MNVQLLSILSVVLVSLVSLAGLLTLSLNEGRTRKLATMLVSFAAGSLLGDAFIHLIPEAFSGGTPPLGQSLLMLAGMMSFFVVEKLMRHRHGAMHAGECGRPELAAMNLLGDGIHNFIDGVLIGASFLAGPSLGISTTVAVLFHEIPQELGDFGVLIQSGLKPRTAVLLNLASASVAILGTISVLLVGAFAGKALVAILLPATAGGFVYLAAADLIPELQHDRSPRALFVQTGLMTMGIGLMALLTIVG